jgi:phosphohistidine phosphatase
VKTLYLLRHAKSSWGDSALADHERPLDPRGERAATLMGVFLQQEGLRPGRVLCSDAARTRQTAERALAGLRPAPRVEIAADLYLAEPEALLARLRGLDERATSALVIGHNPGLHDLARMLVASGETAARRKLDEKLPTGALVEIRIDAARWSDIAAARGALIRFVAPKDLV